MRAGDLRHRVTIQVRTETSDGHDGLTETWADHHRRWAANVVPLAGRELERARAIDPRSSHRVDLRYYSDYLADDLARAQLVWHDGGTDRTLEPVEPPQEVDFRVGLMLTCREAA